MHERQRKISVVWNGIDIEKKNAMCFDRIWYFESNAHWRQNQINNIESENRKILAFSFFIFENTHKFHCTKSPNSKSHRMKCEIFIRYMLPLLCACCYQSLLVLLAVSVLNVCSNDTIFICCRQLVRNSILEIFADYLYRDFWYS